MDCSLIGLNFPNYLSPSARTHIPSETDTPPTTAVLCEPVSIQEGVLFHADAFQQHLVKPAGHSHVLFRKAPLTFIMTGGVLRMRVF